MPTAGATIRYTIDGSVPSLTNGVLYDGALNIASTRVVRARAFKTNFEPSAVQTHSYVFLNDVISNPVMSTVVANDPVYGPKLRPALTNIPSIMISLKGGTPTTAAARKVRTGGRKLACSPGLAMPLTMSHIAARQEVRDLLGRRDGDQAAAEASA